MARGDWAGLLLGEWEAGWQAAQIASLSILDAVRDTPGGRGREASQDSAAIKAIGAGRGQCRINGASWDAG
jgi:hypothetical protein